MPLVTGGIFGPKLSGKTTLAKTLSAQYWKQQQVRTLALDIYAEENVWGEHALVFTDEEKFWEAVWKVQNCLVIVDEAADTIKRDKSLIPVFTRLRHCHHRLIVVGHSGMSLLPIMRQQIDTIFLFRQSAPSAKIWAEEMTESGLLEATTLTQYEFIRHELYGQPKKMKLKL